MDGLIELALGERIAGVEVVRLEQLIEGNARLKPLGLGVTARHRERGAIEEWASHLGDEPQCGFAACTARSRSAGSRPAFLVEVDAAVRDAGVRAAVGRESMAIACSNKLGARIRCLACRT